MDETTTTKQPRMCDRDDSDGCAAVDECQSLSPDGDCETSSLVQKPELDSLLDPEVIDLQGATQYHKRDPYSEPRVPSTDPGDMQIEYDDMVAPVARLPSFSGRAARRSTLEQGQHDADEIRENSVILRRWYGGPVHIFQGPKLDDAPPRATCGDWLRVQMTSRFGHFWAAFQCFVSVVGVLLYLTSLYSTSTWISAADLIVAIFILMDLVVAVIIELHGWRFLFRTNTWVDIISLIPALLHVFETMGALQIEKDSAYHGLLNLMRLLRVGRLMRTYRLISYTGPGTISREVAKLTWAVAVLVLGSSGVFLFLESGHPEAPYFHDGLYYMIVTMTTVGYGDVVPSTPAGRAWMCCFILAAIVIVPPRINKFITVMNERRFKGAFKGTYLMQHMVLIGNIDCVTLDTFLREFYHRNHGPVALDLCILMPEEPDATVRQLLNGEQCGGERSAFLQGNPLCLDDLRRVRVNTAQAVFIVSAKVIGDFAQASDEKTLLTILAIRRISRTVPIYVQVLLPENKNVMYDAGATHVICVLELRLLLLAASCYCPGAQTVIENLSSSVSFTDPVGRHPLPDDEYLAGASYQVYEVRVSGWMVGYDFHSLCQAIYAKFAVLCVGLRAKPAGDMLLLNPMTFQHTFSDGDSVVLLCRSLAAVNAVLRGTCNGELGPRQLRRGEHRCLQQESEIIVQPCTLSGEVEGRDILSLESLPLWCLRVVIGSSEPASVVQEAPSWVRKHVVVIGMPPEIIPFILTLRSKALNTMQAIIFAAHTHGPTPDQLNKIARFPSVYVIVEDNVDEIFRRTLIHRAKVCVLLPSCSEIRDVESSEARVTVILFKLRQWPQVRIVATLPSAKWALFYFPGEAYRSRADEQLDCSPAAFATQMHTQAFTDKLLCNAHYNPVLLEVLPLMVCKPVYHWNPQWHSSHLFLVPVPRELVAARDSTFHDLFLHLLQRKLYVAIGLLRLPDSISKHSSFFGNLNGLHSRPGAARVGTARAAAHAARIGCPVTASANKSAPPSSEGPSTMPYVYLSPPPECLLRDSDRVYVLAAMEPSLEELSRW